MGESPAVTCANALSPGLRGPLEGEERIHQPRVELTASPGFDLLDRFGFHHTRL